METPLIDAAEVARRLGMKRFTVLDLARRGKLPVVQVSSRTVRFDWNRVLEALGQEPEGHSPQAKAAPLGRGETTVKEPSRR